MAFVYQVRSDKDVHFVGAIAQNASEEANISLPSALDGIKGNARSRIRSIIIESDENLAWELWFFGKDLFQESDLDLDYFLGSVTFATGDGLRIGGAGQYCYYREDLDLAYEDFDNSGELHVALVNRSAASKTAGASGEVVVTFYLEPQVAD